MNTQQARNAYPELIIGGVDKNWNVVGTLRGTTAGTILVPFYGGPPSYKEGQKVNLRFHPVAAPAFRAMASVCLYHGYPFRESAGGSLVFRKITGGPKTSIHAHGCACDINPKANPFGSSKPDELDQAKWAALVRDLKAIKTIDGHRVFRWGGDWAEDDDMHWECTQCSRPQLERGIDWKTVKGWAAYQKWAGAPATPSNPTTPKTPTKDDEVELTKNIQKALNSAGARDNAGKALVVDGVWGPKTEQAFVRGLKMGSGTTAGADATARKQAADAKKSADAAAAAVNKLRTHLRAS